jgi:excisionase family DNA binding protein
MTAATDVAVYTVCEAAAVLRIGRSAAYAAVQAGQIPSIRVGGRIRVPRHQLERMLGLHQDDDPAAGGAKVAIQSTTHTGG